MVPNVIVNFMGIDVEDIKHKKISGYLIKELIQRVMNAIIDDFGEKTVIFKLNIAIFSLLGPSMQFLPFELR